VGPSPEWLTTRLMLAGVRPINNVVDVTNYVMLEIGQPMHAFDFETLAGRTIRVRRARAGESIRTLDGERRTLEESMLVIADGERAQAIAGVMGGADSEVSDRTTLVLLESAYFDPRSVRRTSRQLGLKTEASARFERGADPSMQAAAIERACVLLGRVAAGDALGPLIDCHPAPSAARRVALRRARVGRILGFEVPDAEIERILGRLGFRLTPDADGWLAVVPAGRVDVAREIDLIEEVGRHAGFDRVPTTYPAARRFEAGLAAPIAWDRLARKVLTSAGFSEAVTFAFIERDAAEPFVDAADDLVPIANPLSEKFAVLRPSLLPGLLDAVAYNRRRERRDIRLFEISASFSARGGETRRAAFALTGTAVADHWSGRGRPADFFDARGVVDALCAAFGAGARLAPLESRYLVRGRAASIAAGGAGGAPVTLGVVGQLVPRLAAARGFTGSDELYVAEIDLAALAGLAESIEDVRVQPLPRHPSVVRDLSVDIDRGLPSEAIRETIRTAAPPTLVSVREFDRYRGEGVAGGRVSLSLRLTFRDPDRTLTDAEVQRAMDGILAALAAAHGAVQR
jgi:phenylalanyl-tRNA synthetase beta chain